MGISLAQNDVFCNFLESELYVFLEIECNDNLQQCLRSSRSKTYNEKNLAKIGPEMRFFVIFKSFTCYFFCKLHRMMSNYYGVRTHEKNWRSKIGPKISHFLKFASIVFLDIAQNCILGQSLTSSRPEASKKNFVT